MFITFVVIEGRSHKCLVTFIVIEGHSHKCLVTFVVIEGRSHKYLVTFVVIEGCAMTAVSPFQVPLQKPFSANRVWTYQ